MLLDSLNFAVETGAITAEQAAAEWEKYTRVQRTAGEVAWGVINPVQGLVDVTGDLNATMGVVGEQQVIVSRELDNTARAAFQAAAGIGAVANVAAGSAGQLQSLGGMYAGLGAALAAINAEMGQGGTDEEESIVGLGTETGRKEAVNDLKADLKAIIEEAARLEDERYAENKARAVSAHENEMSMLLAEHAAAKAQQTDRMAGEQARIQMIQQMGRSLSGFRDFSRVSCGRCSAH
jgi:hypothetical protein